METVIESGLAPDFAIRAGIRRSLARRLRDEARVAGTEAFVESLRTSPLEVHTRAANEQDYELPTEFHALFLGKRLEYSAAYAFGGKCFERIVSVETFEHAPHSAAVKA